ncbi:hypothetical protein QZH41_014330, partial [Actinostola sp. cb2023]
NPSRTSALLIVDVQNDFISGSLALKHCPACEDGYDVVNVINGILNHRHFDHIVYTLDWHPQNHCSFIDNVHLYAVHESSPVAAQDAKVFDTVVYSEPVVVKQKLWPVHCVQDSWGAELHKELRAPEKEDHLCKKGYQPYIDSYSAFWSSGHFCHTDLFKILLKKGVTDVYICGLAIDYCVKFTARDAAQHGFNVYVVEDACRSISHEGCCQAKAEFKKDGVILLDSTEVRFMNDTRVLIFRKA